MAEQQRAANAAAALPWAAAASASRGKASEGAQSLATLATNDVTPLQLDQVGLQPGARIEVKWHLETDDGDSHSKWWGATITGVAPAAADAAASAAGSEAAAAPPRPPSSGSSRQQRLTYQLRYDACEGFEEETAEVLLLGEHELFDRGARGVMVWRSEGDTAFDPPDEAMDGEGEAGNGDEEEGGDGDEEVQGGTVSLSQLAELMAAAAAGGGGGGGHPADTAAGGGGGGGGRAVGRGVSLGSAVLDELAAAADPAQLASVEAGFKDFMAQFKAYAAAKAGSGGEGVLITKDDVAEFAAMMRTQQRHGHHHHR